MKYISGSVLLWFCSALFSIAFAYTDNSVLPTIQPFTASISFDSTDVAACLASDPSNTDFELFSYSGGTGPFLYQDLPFADVPGTLATTSSVGASLEEVLVYCTADPGTLTPDYGAPFWGWSAGWHGPGTPGNSVSFDTVDLSSGSTTTSSATTSATEVLATSWLLFSVFLTFIISIVVTIWTYRQLM